MAASVSGAKTVSNDVSPEFTAAKLTTLLAIAIENMTVAQYDQIRNALSRVASGGDGSKTIGSLLV